jgi:hypothetical protein
MPAKLVFQFIRILRFDFAPRILSGGYGRGSRQ